MLEKNKDKIFQAGLAVIIISSISNSTVAFEMEEVLVTSQKRMQSVQDVSASLLALDANTLRTAGAVNINDVMNLTPGSALTQFSNNQSVITLRGVGSGDDGAASDAATAVHIDGIFLSRDGSRTFPMYDMERVEVMRGPQGTIYGKNALAGVVNFITKNPHEDKEVVGEINVGNYNLVEIKGAVNTPLTDKLNLRVAGNFSQRDGYFENLATGNDLDDVDNQSIRVSTLYLPADDLEVLFVADYSRDDTAGPARKPRPEFGADFLASSLGLAIPSTTDDIYKVELNTDGGFERDNYGVMLQVDKEFEDGDLSWLTGYRSLDYDTIYDLDGTLQNFRAQGIDEESSQFSTELRYVSAPATSKGELEYITGLYYLVVDTDRMEWQESWNGITLDELISNPFVPPVPQDTITEHDQSNETTSMAAYVDFKYKALDALTLIFGARYSYEKKDFSVDAYCGLDDVPFSSDNNGGNGGPGNVNSCNAAVQPDASNQSQFSAKADETWSQITMRTGLEYEFADYSLGYFTYSQGFKSGGFGPGAANEVLAETPFDEELADSFELGYKVDFWDNKARANISIFYTEYTDLQVGVLDPVSGALAIANAGDAETQGFELELAAKPSEALTLQFSYAYVDAEYTDFVLNDTDFAGNKLRGPENSGTLSATYDIALGDAGLSLHADYNYKDDFYQFHDEDPRTLIPSREIINLRVTYTPASEKWYLALWGKNITDEEELLQVVPPPASIGSNVASSIYGPPATYGVTVGFDF